MKICLISNLYPPHARGGAEKVAEAMAAGFISAGHSVIIISTKPGTGLTIEQKSGRCRIYRFKPLNVFYYLNDYKYSAPIRLLWHFFDMFNIAAALTIRGVLRSERPDIVITHNLKGIGLLTSKIVARAKIKHVHVLHDVQLVVPSGLIIKECEKDFAVAGLPTRIYAAICRWLFNGVGAVVSPSEWLMDFYVANGFFKYAKRAVVRNPSGSSVAARLLSVKKREKKTFLFVGQVEKHKGVEWLVDFWNKNKIENELSVVGDGSLRTDGFIDLLTGNIPVKFVGRIEGDALAKIFSDAAFLIVPSLCYENSPTVIQLAFQNGVPVIVADIGGAAELVEDDKTGFVFRAGDEESFAAALKRARELSDEGRERMARNCLAVAERFYLKDYIKKIENLF